MGSALQCRCRYAEDLIRSITKLFGDRCRRCLIALKQSLPNRTNAASERCNPPHAGNRKTHALKLRIRIDAFVPPNPKEFESTVRKAARRASFATMSS